MAAFLGRRLLEFVATLLAVSVLIFLVMDVLPGDPASVMLGTAARPDTLAALRLEMGLDRPVALRYAAWIGGVVSGDFGRSVTYGVPVLGLIGERLAVTLPLALLAMLLAVAAALPLALLAASRHGGPIDALASVFSQGAIAVPSFWVGLLLILLFAVTLRWLPSGGFPGWSAGGLSGGLRALLLPATALALPQAGILTRVARSAVLEVMNEDFVRTARAKGLTRRAALWRHVLPNALVPVVTIIGLQFAFFLSGSVLVENVFGLPGLGRLAYQAFAQRDLIVMQDVVLFFAGLVILVNFLVDLSYFALDPRLRARGAG